MPITLALSSLPRGYVPHVSNSPNSRFDHDRSSRWVTLNWDIISFLSRFFSLHPFNQLLAQIFRVRTTFALLVNSSLFGASTRITYFIFHFNFLLFFLFPRPLAFPFRPTFSPIFVLMDFPFPFSKTVHVAAVHRGDGPFIRVSISPLNFARPR
jgi:hypothetical protein